MHFLSSDFHTTSARKTKCSALCQKYFELSCEILNYFGGESFLGMTTILTQGA
jgi:hypothetical protein